MEKRYLNTKNKWFTSHILTEEQAHKPLLECLLRDLVPFDILDYIDFNSLVDLKTKIAKQFDRYESKDIRILKNIVTNNKRYELIISVLEPEYDYEKDSFQFFIVFTEPVNNIPYDKRSIKVVIKSDPTKTKLKDDFDITTAMIFQPWKEDGDFCEEVVQYFEKVNFDAIRNYNSVILQNILFNYLCFFKIRKISETNTSYSALCVNGDYYIYKDGHNDCLVCVLYQKDVYKVIDKMVGKKGKITPKPKKMLYVVYLEKSNDDYIPDNQNIKIVSVEDYLNVVNIVYTEEELCKLKSQILFLHKLCMADSENCYIQNEMGNDNLIKNGFTFFDKNISNVKYVKESDTYSYKVEESRLIKNDKIKYQEKGYGIKIIRQEPCAIKDMSRCFYYRYAKTLQVVTVEGERCAVRNILVIPENNTTFCKISESMLREVEEKLKNVNDIEQWDKQKWFNYLCAINLVYAYNKYQKHNAIIGISLKLIYRYIDNLREKNIMEFGYDNNNLLVSINVEYRQYQFLFAITQEDLKFLKDSKCVNKGELDGIQLLPIAPLLYSYSEYLLKRDELPQVQ